jgi:hypothetical protein
VLLQALEADAARIERMDGLDQVREGAAQSVLRFCPDKGPPVANGQFLAAGFVKL